MRTPAVREVLTDEISCRLTERALLPEPIRDYQDDDCCRADGELHAQPDIPVFPVHGLGPPAKYTLVAIALGLLTVPLQKRCQTCVVPIWMNRAGENVDETLIRRGHGQWLGAKNAAQCISNYTRIFNKWREKASRSSVRAVRSAYAKAPADSLREEPERRLVSRLGIEPRTRRLRVCCSTN